MDIRVQADICEQSFTGKGIYRQKSQIDPKSGRRIYSIRWEMEYFMEDFSCFTLRTLNGERGKLWRQDEKRYARPGSRIEYGDLEVVDLNEALRAVAAYPEARQTLDEPWFRVFHVDQLLEGIRQTFTFTVAGETYYPGSQRVLYQLRGALKKDLALKIANRPNVEKKKADGEKFGARIPDDELTREDFDRFLSRLPGEAPTYVELFIDKELEFPVFINFFRQQGEEEDAHEGKRTPELRFGISFENTYLNNAAFRAEEFEIMPENVTKDATAFYIQSLKNAARSK